LQSNQSKLDNQGKVSCQVNPINRELKGFSCSPVIPIKLSCQGIHAFPVIPVIKANHSKQVIAGFQAYQLIPVIE
jgi:hypothetical protein